MGMGKGDKVDKSEIIDGLYRMMMIADNEADYMTLTGAIEIIRKATQDKQKSILLPCEIGDKVYSIIENGIGIYTVSAFRIDTDGAYAVTEERGMFFKLDKFGEYFFTDGTVAEREYNRVWKRTG